MSQRIRNESFVCGFIREAPAALYDIGVGPKSEWLTLSRKYSTMRVFGCEPHPSQYATLLRKKCPGRLSNVAIGENEGPAMLYVTDDLTPPCAAYEPRVSLAP